MKKMYEAPAVEITAIAAEDIITASGLCCEPDFTFSKDSFKLGGSENNIQIVK